MIDDLDSKSDPEEIMQACIQQSIHVLSSAIPVLSLFPRPPASPSPAWLCLPHVVSGLQRDGVHGLGAMLLVWVVGV